MGCFNESRIMPAQRRVFKNLDARRRSAEAQARLWIERDPGQRRDMLHVDHVMGPAYSRAHLDQEVRAAADRAGTVAVFGQYTDRLFERGRRFIMDFVQVGLSLPKETQHVR